MKIDSLVLIVTAFKQKKKLNYDQTKESNFVCWNPKHVLENSKKYTMQFLILIEKNPSLHKNSQGFALPNSVRGTYATVMETLFQIKCIIGRLTQNEKIIRSVLFIGFYKLYRP